VDTSRIVALLSPAERRTARRYLGELTQVRKRAHKALVALGDDVIAWRNAGTPSASHLETLQAVLASAMGELRVVAETLADRCPIPSEWARLKEFDHLLRGQREKLYQTDIWEREVTQRMKDEHGAVIAQMGELDSALGRAGTLFHRGRTQKYSAKLVGYVKDLRSRTPQPKWKDVYRKCKKRFPRVKYPKCKSFIRVMQRLIAE
jgi:hypothetical protein